MTMHKTQLTTIAIVISIILGGTTGCNNDSNSSTQPVVKNDAYYKSLAEGFVAKMTADEKIKMLIGPGYTTTQAPDGSTTFGTDYSQIANVKIVPGAAGYINGVYNESSGLNIPAAKLVDGPAGIRIYPTREGQEGLETESGTFYATAFPTGTLLASTWNADLAKEVGQAAGNEAKEYGVDFWLAPGMNIQRNPLNGRNFEYYSEDPLISGVIASSVVDGAQSEGIGVTVKHFAANNSETNRRTVNAVVTPRALREIYLRGFEYAVETSQPWALMTSYNSINGVNAGERTDLITNILRDEWGFKGFAMSDWWSGWDPVALVKAGTDVIQPGGAYRITRSADSWLTILQNAHTNNLLSDDVINRDVVRTLTQVLKAPSGQKYQYSNNPDLNGHAQIAKIAAEEGMVLLKNDGSVLPIVTSQKIASFGIGQINTFKGGTGSGDVHSAYIKNIADGLSEKYSVDADLSSFYQTYFNTNKTVTTDVFGVSQVIVCPEPEVTIDQVNASATSSDVAVITISRNAGEGSDRTAVKGDYLLTDTETALINNVSTVFHAQNKKVVVILNIGGVIDTTSWKDKVDGILLAYQPGQEAGYAVADIISGAVSPSGKLAQTFPASYTDVPSSATFPGVTESTFDNAGPVEPYVNTSNTPKVADYNEYYNEDIYVGYRYYNTFNKGVAYPFGYGLSYTTFSFGDSAVTANTLSSGSKGNLTISTNVTNTGSVAGKEVAEVYVNAPEVKLKKPTIELKAFAKTSKLEAGTAQKLTFNISAETLASFDDANNQWIVEPGVYKVYVSSSSDVSAVEPLTFTVDKEIVVGKTTPGALALQSKFADKSFVTVTK